MPDLLADRLRVIRLFDAYGKLLTARRQRLLRLYYHDDLSLGEIAARLRVTRQAVSDTLRRSVEELEHLETSLGLLQSRAAATRRARALRARLRALEAAVHSLTRRIGTRAVSGLAREVDALRRLAP